MRPDHVVTTEVEERVKSERELIRMGRRGKGGGGVDAMNVDCYIVDDGCK